MDSGFQVPYSGFLVSGTWGPVIIYRPGKGGGGAFDFWGDNLIFMRTKGGSLVTEKKGKKCCVSNSVSLTVANCLH